MALLAVGLPAAADESDNAATPTALFDSEFYFGFGGYFSYVDSDVELSTPGFPSVPIDLEDSTGLDEWSASAWVAFSWRYHPRHSVHVEWFQLNRSGTQNLSAQLPPIGGTVYGAGVDLDTFFDINIGRVSYAYSMLQDENDSLKFVAGLHIATVKAGFTGSGFISVDGQQFRSQTVSEETSSVSLPLPHLGLSYTRKLSPRWSVNGTFLAFALDVGSLSGHLIQVDGTVAYQVAEHFGLGGGVKYYNVNVTSRSSDLDAQFDMQFIGPTIFLYTNF